MKLGAAIKDARKRAGLKQGELAAHVDLTQSYLSQIESGKREPHLSKLKRIAEVLEIPMPVLFLFSMEVEDVSPDRREAYRRLYPRFKRMFEKEFADSKRQNQQPAQ